MLPVIDNNSCLSRVVIPDIGGVVVFCPGQKVCLHDLLGVVRWYLPDGRVSLVTSLRQLQVQVSSTAVHLQDLDGGGVRVVHLNHRVVARVERQLDPNQWFDNVEVIVAEKVGRETVQYVGNIFKYYLTYRWINTADAERAAARRASGIED